MTEILVAQNPRFMPGRPMSYESIHCRLAGWWTMQPNESSLSPEEIILLRLEPM